MRNLHINSTYELLVIQWRLSIKVSTSGSTTGLPAQCWVFTHQATLEGSGKQSTSD